MLPHSFSLGSFSPQYILKVIAPGTLIVSVILHIIKADLLVVNTKNVKVIEKLINSELQFNIRWHLPCLYNQIITGGFKNLCITNFTASVGIQVGKVYLTL